MPEPHPSLPARRSALFALVIAASLTGASEPSANGPVLRLIGGGFVPGTLADSDDPKTLRWQGSAFVEPFDFRLGAVEGVHAPVPGDPPRPVGEFRIELAGGDVVFGTLVALDDDEAVLDTPRFGRLHVRRTAVRRVERWGNNPDLVYLGPNGLADWQVSGANAWHVESGSPFTDQEGATLSASPGIPMRAAIEVDLSWKTTPDFVLAVGVNPSETSAARAFRFEVWDGELVALRETEGDADLASLGRLVAEGSTVQAGRVRLRAYLDQGQGTLVVFSAKGERLADLKVGGKATEAAPGILLVNRHGDVRLDRLRISRWNGDSPRGTGNEAADLHRLDGSGVAGRLVRFDADARAFVVRGDGDKETRVTVDQVARLTLSPPADDAPRALNVVLQDGTRLSGDPAKVKNGELWLNVPGVKESAHLPAAELRSLVVAPLSGTPNESEKPPLLPRLELNGVRLSGQLVDGRERPGASCLTWRPTGSASASPLRPGVSGRILFKEPPQKPTTPQPAQVPGQIQMGFQGQVVMGQVRVQRRQGVGGVQGFLKGFAGDESARASQGRRSLYLRTGDVITADVTKIDEDGVWFRSPMSDQTFVPHDKVKAAELAFEPSATTRINKPKRERLLTVPRMQKGSPPTHLVRSRNGDYLRGRVVGMDEKMLHVEVRLETKDVPRDRISRIIWLHADEIDPPKPVETPKTNDEATRVQVVRGDGIRLTFRAERLKETTLSGTSDVLGVCRVRLDEAERILIGSAVAQETARLAYQQWKLQNAPEPKLSPGDGGPDGGEGRAAGTESAMVGKPAPDFTLALLGSKTPFRLSESKGKNVVVLDFWATWCGPCIQAMPQVEEVTKEFREQGVRLVAVNLQETPAVISAMLERHKLGPTVALDRDGAVAEKYGATAIPQTVVIDRDGNVARLFIGGGPHLGEKLREALKAATKPAEAKGP